MLKDPSGLSTQASKATPGAQSTSTRTMKSMRRVSRPSFELPFSLNESRQDGRGGRCAAGGVASNHTVKHQPGPPSKISRNQRAPDPEPGREVRHIYRSRCGTEV